MKSRKIMMIVASIVVLLSIGGCSVKHKDAEEFDEGLWSSLVQEVVVNTKDDILFIFKNGFEIKTR